MLNLKTATLSIQLLQDRFFIHPPASIHELAEEEEILVRGTATLKLHRAQKVAISAEMLGRFTLRYPSTQNGPATESGEHCREVLQLQESKRYEAGVHKFEFSFLVKHSHANHENNPYCTVTNKIKVTAHGAGIAKSNLTASSEIFLIPNASTKGDPAAPLDLSYQGSNEALGAYLCVGVADALLVAGLISVGFQIPCSSSTVYLQYFRITIIQAYELTSPTTKRNFICRPWRLCILDKRLNNQKLEKGKEFALEETTRLPDDTVLSATTLPGTSSPCRVSHYIEIDLKYCTSENIGKRKTLRIRKGIEIASCACRTEALTLPSYQDALLTPIYDPKLPTHAQTSPGSCMCSVPTPTLMAKSRISPIEQQGEWLWTAKLESSEMSMPQQLVLF